MNYYTGTHTCELDTKGRVVVPSAFRKVTDEHYDGWLILSPSLEESGCVEAYPEPEWDSFLSQIENAQNMGVGESRQLRGALFGRADRTKIDGQKRLSLVHKMRDVLGVDGSDENVTLAFVGAGSYFKVYVAAEYQQAEEQRLGQVKELMKKFMAGPNHPQSGGGRGEG